MSRTGQPPRNRRARRWIILLLVLVLPGHFLASGLLTTAGARWLAQRLTARLPGLALHVESGNLWSGPLLRDIAWAADDTRIELDRLATRWRFQLLPRPALQIERLHASGLRVTRPPAPPADPPLPWYEALDPARRQPVQLPSLRLPLPVRLRDARLEQATFDLGGPVHHVTALAVSLDAHGDRLRIRSFRLDHDLVQADAHGTLHFSGDYPLDLTVQLHSDRLLPPHALELNARLSQSLADLAFTVRLDGIGPLEASGTLRPLDPHLPVHGTLVWQTLAWPLHDTPIVTSTSGHFEFHGSLESHAIDGSLDLAGPSLPESRWDLRGHGDLRHLQIDQLSAALLGGSLEAAATLSWTNGLAWQARLTAADLDAAAWHPAAPSPVDARLASSGRWADLEWAMDLDVQSATTRWRGLPLKLQGRLEGDSAACWSVADATLHCRENVLRLSGSYTDELDVAGTLDLPALDAFLPELAGRIEAAWTLRGPLQAPDLGIELHGSELAHGDTVHLAAAHLEASISALAMEDSHIRLTLHDVTAPARDIQLDSVRLHASGTRADHRVRLEAEGLPSHLSLALDGGLDPAAAAWSGTVASATVAPFGHPWVLEQPVALHWDSAAGPFTIAAHRWRHADAVLHAPEPLMLGAEGAVHLRLDGFDLTELQPLLPGDIHLRGLLAAAVDVRWAPDAIPEGTGSIELHDAGLALIVADNLFVEDAPPLDVAFDTLALQARLAEATFSARFDLAAPGLGAIRAETSIDIAPDRTLSAWSGDFALDTLKLDVLQPFLSDLRTLSGDASAAIRLSGSPRRPLLHGTVTLTNGVIEPAAFPVTLGDLHLAGDLQGDRATWTGGFRSGRGLAVLQGEMERRADAWHADLHLAGERLELAYGTLATLQADPDLHLRIEPRTISLSGVVRIPQADILIQQLPETAVAVSPDAVIVDDSDEALPAAAPPAWSRSIDLDLRLGDRITLGGLGITGRLAGDLRLQQTGHAMPLAFGELRIEDGRYRAYGQRLQIRRGQFLFAGPIDQPTLSIEAIRDVPAHGVVAGLRVEGRPDALQSSLFSEPALPEEEILAFLLLGRPLERGEESDTNVMLARAAIALGIAGGGGTITSLAETLGIEHFQLDTAGEGDDTQVVVSGMVSSRLQLSYGVGVFVPANTLTARYRLARRLFLEAVSGLESSLDLIYTFRF